ncbi:MAG TPA: cytochrome c oxidase subunit II [Geminicoccaceae bacterium]
MTLVRSLVATQAAMLFGSGAALAQSDREPWQLGMVPAQSPTMESLSSLHDLLLWICILISLFVLALLAYACVRFRASRNPTPSRRTHNPVLEIAWTAIPVLILVVIAIPSFKLLYYMDTAANPEMTLKAIGRQWYWSYEYPDHGNFTFDAYMIADADLQEGQPRLLATDNHVVVPAETDIRLLTTASDVLHSWAMPVAGIKMDAVPGRINETWFRMEEPGIYYGQCSELCGSYHGFMPITLEVLPKDEFEAWVKQAQEQFAKAGEPDTQVARAHGE